MDEKPTIEEHAKNMEDAWRSAEEQNIIFSRKIDALKGAVRSAVQQCNDKDEDYAALERMYIQHRDEVARLRGALRHVSKMQTLGYIVLGEEATGMIEQALGQAAQGVMKSNSPVHILLNDESAMPSGVYRGFRIRLWKLWIDVKWLDKQADGGKETTERGQDESD